MKSLIFLSAALVGFLSNLFSQINYPDISPGIAQSKKLTKNRVILENDILNVQFMVSKSKLSFLEFKDKRTQEIIKFYKPTIFEFLIPGLGSIASDDFKLKSDITIENIEPDSNSLTLSHKFSGKKISAYLESSSSSLEVKWEACLRDNSNYIQQIISISSRGTVNISEIRLVNIPVSSGFELKGSVGGLPLTHRNTFVAVEHPLSNIEKVDGNYIASLPIARSITPLNPFSVSVVMGTTPVGQLRRGFLYYVERERTSPYHQMLHYNSWSDIAWMDRKMNEQICMFRVKMIGDSLIRKRGITLDAFLFDDGWDDNQTLWEFHSGFPEGFHNLKREVENYNSTLGVWISPFGGYSHAKKQRLEYGKNHVPPFETNDNGFSLSGPQYYAHIKKVLSNFIKTYNISILKFDGMGAGYLAKDASIYHKDMESFLNLTDELRAIKNDIYFLLTTGTWPSPFFLKYGDIIWRGGHDFAFLGKGSKRQQWINFRDADIYKHVVKRSPLYPLNALQCAGFYMTDIGEPGEFEVNEKTVSDDIWMGLGTGTSVQGMYINPNRMTTQLWDELAVAIKWAGKNEDVMADMHWVGGDPANEEVYGYAAWSPKKAVLTLRNPSDQPQTYEVNAASVFELPDGSNDQYLFYDAKRIKYGSAVEPVFKGSSFKITLQPLEVRVFDAVPK